MLQVPENNPSLLYYAEPQGDWRRRMPVLEELPVEVEAPLTHKANLILARAAEVIKRDGWCQGTYHNEKGNHCAIGAMLQAMKELGGAFTTPVNRVRARIHFCSVNSIVCVPVWNDKLERTKEEVIAALEVAARIEPKEPL